ncbi:hypothetical protein CYLTODRAFT_371410 [Cylindrobasidium torrendii FP15055 ss-10]|uniref:SH3 domain-containing protein n=1 Tax=Cylindrobasidium torrendii FP15055 ss-10 TaxID=1314674 RepID=A0A0D7BHU6_9AGAR|nr:hypothetical protein CYLTODRAFT_371410 [Cylindrobasidium torrendii FP15055 ss-10]
MPAPPIQLFLTTIASQPALRQRQEYTLRILQVKKIPFTSYDLASDEKAKSLWKRKAPAGAQLPGMLVGGKYPGPFNEFEDAVEYGELDIFLRLKEDWKPDDWESNQANLPTGPVGVPGAMTPLEMTPERLRDKIKMQPTGSSLKPVPINKQSDADKVDLGEQISGFGLQGLKATEDELADLVAELGLDGDAASDLVKGLRGNVSEGEDDRLPSPSPEAKKPLPTPSLSIAPKTTAAKALDTSKQDAAPAKDDAKAELTKEQSKAAPKAGGQATAPLKFGDSAKVVTPVKEVDVKDLAPEKASESAPVVPPTSDIPVKEAKADQPPADEPPKAEDPETKKEAESVKEDVVQPEEETVVEVFQDKAVEPVKAETNEAKVDAVAPTKTEHVKDVVEPTKETVPEVTKETPEPKKEETKVDDTKE